MLSTRMNRWTIAAITAASLTAASGVAWAQTPDHPADNAAQVPTKADLKSLTTAGSYLAARHPGEALASLTASDRWPLLVLDEPTAGLDAQGVSGLVEAIAALSRKGRAIAVITHDMDLALRLCPRSVIVGEGAILAEAPTGELMSDTALLARAGLAEPSCAPAMRWLRRAAAC